MTGHYKEVGDRYVYQIPLEEEGYWLYDAFTYQRQEDGFIFPKTLSGWDMRRAIRNWIEGNPDIFKNYDWKIVRANGYWRDLHGKYVYELWVKERLT